jgi:hypothetical protein
LSINEKIKSTCKQYTWCVQTTNHVLHLVNSTNPSSPNHSLVFHISNHKFIVRGFSENPLQNEWNAKWIGFIFPCSIQNVWGVQNEKY